MTEVNSKENWLVIVGLIGIVGLLVASLSYALKDSGTHYEAEKINQVVLDHQSPTSERSR